jgi:ubiquitin-protein ligase
VSPRERRLEADHRLMAELAATGKLSFQFEGIPPERYVIDLHVAGFGRNADGLPELRETHTFEVYLPVDYPRRPPLLEWLTPIFHPNILPPERHGAVCIGSWTASESLADLCLRLHDLVGYRTFSVDDPLDRRAAAWVRHAEISQGDDLHEALAGV